MARTRTTKKTGVKREVRCYLCGHRFDVSSKTLSTACPGCFSAIKVEDVVVKSYVPVNDLQTCGKITVLRRGRVAAKNIQCGEGIVCEGTMEGAIETDADVEFGPKASWKGKGLRCRALRIAPGATLDGPISVPWKRPETEAPVDKIKRRARTVRGEAKPASKATTAATVVETKPETPEPAVAVAATADAEAATEATAVMRPAVAKKVTPRPSTRRTSGPATKKVAAKKTVTKKTAAKKATTKKVVAKKATTKKVAAKKTPAKKTPAKKAATKKTTTKKSIAKKTTTRKTATKNATTKKVAARKSTTKKKTSK